jgi:collagenase-like PrtC family protease
VQANTVNHAAVKFWRAAGISRVILSRELSLDEVAEIRQECPDTELEVFVHGALCIAYSGRCLLSGYFNHRDPNQGSCTNSCRWDYKVHEGSEDATGDVGLAVPRAPTFPAAPSTLRRPGAWLIEERERPGEYMPIEEDEHGSYILNSKDLRAIEYVARLAEIGVDSLKIEGRTKSAYYVARSCQSYRQAIDDAVAGRPFDPQLIGQLDGLANRGYTAGFYERHPDRDYQNYLRGSSESSRSQYVGDVTGYGADGLAEIAVKNRFAVGDRLEIVRPQGNLELTIEACAMPRGDAHRRRPRQRPPRAHRRCRPAARAPSSRATCEPARNPHPDLSRVLGDLRQLRPGRHHGVGDPGQARRHGQVRRQRDHPGNRQGRARHPDPARRHRGRGLRRGRPACRRGDAGDDHRYGRLRLRRAGWGAGEGPKAKSRRWRDGGCSA